MYCGQCSGGGSNTVRNFHTAAAVAWLQCAAMCRAINDSSHKIWQLLMDSQAVLVRHSGWMKFLAKSFLNDSTMIWLRISSGCVCSLIPLSVGLAQPPTFVFFQVLACINVASMCSLGHLIDMKCSGLCAINLSHWCSFHPSIRLNVRIDHWKDQDPHVLQCHAIALTPTNLRQKERVTTSNSSKIAMTIAPKGIHSST